MGVDKKEFEQHQSMEHSTRGKYIRQFIFGTEDGLIGNLGLITGVSVATLNPAIIILSGIALMLTQAVSMGAGVYLSVKSQREYYDRVLEQEIQEIEEVPEIEREEVRQIYKEHGFRGKRLEQMVKMITSNKKTWLNVMMAEEFGLSKKGLESPGTAMVVMALSVMLGAFIPIAPHFFFAASTALTASFVATVIALFVFGASKTLFTKKNVIRSGLEMVVVGMIAAGAGWLIGSVFAVV